MASNNNEDGPFLIAIGAGILAGSYAYYRDFSGMSSAVIAIGSALLLYGVLYAIKSILYSINQSMGSNGYKISPSAAFILSMWLALITIVLAAICYILIVNGSIASVLQK